MLILKGDGTGSRRGSRFATKALHRENLRINNQVKAIVSMKRTVRVSRSGGAARRGGT